MDKLTELHRSISKVSSQVESKSESDKAMKVRLDGLEQSQKDLKDNQGNVMEMLQKILTQLPKKDDGEGREKEDKEIPMIPKGEENEDDKMPMIPKEEEKEDEEMPKGEEKEDEEKEIE